MPPTKGKAGREPRVSKENFLIALRQRADGIAGVCKLYNAPQRTIYRWLKEDKNFCSSYSEIITSPDYKLRKRMRTRGNAIPQEMKPTFCEALLAKLRDNGGKVIDACRHVGIDFVLYKNALDPAHPSHEPWFATRIKEMWEELDQQALDDARVMGRTNPAILRLLLERPHLVKGIAKMEDDAGLDDASVQGLLRELREKIEQEKADIAARGEAAEMALSLGTGAEIDS